MRLRQPEPSVLGSSPAAAQRPAVVAAAAVVVATHENFCRMQLLEPKRLMEKFPAERWGQRLANFSTASTQQALTQRGIDVKGIRICIQPSESLRGPLKTGRRATVQGAQKNKQENAPEPLEE